MTAQKLLILGGGESGVGCAKLGIAKGFEVFLSDAGSLKAKHRQQLKALGVKFEENGHSDRAYSPYHIVVKSPGIPERAAIIQHFRDEKTEVISEIEFAYRYTNAKIIAITGTNGKTTTTMLTYHLLKKAGLDVAMGGNVGISMAGLLAERDYEYLVLEVSSFQLDDIVSFKPFIGMILNITPDHLERYDSYDAYALAKFKMTKNQTAEDFLIYELESEKVKEMIEKHLIKSRLMPISIEREIEEGGFYSDVEKTITITVNHKPITMSIHELALQGKHNIYNSMAAAVAGRILELRKDIIRESLCDFQNVEHRLEHVAKVCGVKYINDSKATNVNSAWYALESADAPVIWIAGGVDKGNDYTALLPLVKEKVKAIVCLGVNNSKIKDYFGSTIEFIFEAQSMREAVAIAYRLAQKEDTVLLSPACASFDLFENYEDRGRQFKEAVRAL